MIDPDYRTKIWNKSKFAPKNSHIKGAMTQMASVYATIIILIVYGGIPYILPDVRPAFWSWQGFVVGFLVWSATFGYIGRRILTKEWNRLQRMLAEEETNRLSYDKPASQSSSVKPLYKLSPTEFEREVAWLFNVLTPTKALVVGGAGDGGVDVELHKDGKVVGIVQCKKYDPARVLQPDHIRAFYATKVQREISRAYLVTTARVSKQSLKEAKKLGIQIMAGDELNEHYNKAKLST
jgi:hypothetical protein